MKPQRIVCGIRPTGNVHIGNYYGAIKPAVELAKEFSDSSEAEGFFFIADLHAITSGSHDPRSLGPETLSTAALYLAAGLDTRNGRNHLFIQSHVPAVSELARLLGSITTMGTLKRMTQFKEKARAGQDNEGDAASLALFDYPVLMAADILSYGASHVPTGDDQRQHLELTRDLVQRFNKLYGKDFRLRQPEAHTVTSAARIKSLSDGSKKMSKSDNNDFSRINLLDDAAAIERKIKKARTDSQRGLEFDNQERPEVHNLLTIYALASGESRRTIAARCADMGNAEFKELLSKALISDLSAVQESYQALMQNPEKIHAILKEGAARANALAEGTLAACKKAMGFLITD